MDRDAMMLQIRAYIKKYHPKSRLADPDYSFAKCYPPQWKAFGHLDYYQVGGKIIAVRDRFNNTYHFNPRGYSHGRLQQVVREHSTKQRTYRSVL